MWSMATARFESRVVSDGSKTVRRFLGRPDRSGCCFSQNKGRGEKEKTFPRRPFVFFPYRL